MKITYLAAPKSQLITPPIRSNVMVSENKTNPMASPRKVCGDILTILRCID